MRPEGITSGNRRIHHCVVDQHSKHPASGYMDRVFVNGKPLRRCLGIIRGKLQIILDDPGERAVGAATDGAAIVLGNGDDTN